MKVLVNLELCMGSGSCKQLAPTVFDQNDDGTVILLQEQPNAELHDDVQKAVYCCPSQAITVTQD